MEPSQEVAAGDGQLGAMTDAAHAVRRWARPVRRAQADDDRYLDHIAERGGRVGAGPTEGGHLYVVGPGRRYCRRGGGHGPVRQDGDVRALELVAPRARTTCTEYDLSGKVGGAPEPAPADRDRGSACDRPAGNAGAQRARDAGHNRRDGGVLEIVEIDVPDRRDVGARTSRRRHGHEVVGSRRHGRGSDAQRAVRVTHPAATAPGDLRRGNGDDDAGPAVGSCRDIRRGGPTWVGACLLDEIDARAVDEAVTRDRDRLG